MRSRNLIFVLIIIMISMPVFSQDGIFEDNQGHLSVGLNFQMWKNSGFYNPFSQLMVPISLMLPVNDRFNVNISHSPAMTWRYGDYNILGLSDTWIQGNYFLWSDKLMLNVGVGLPTGKTRVDSSQFVLLQDISKDIYRFKLPVYGQGFSGKFGLAFSFPMSEAVVIGFGGQYLIRGAYHPVEYEYGSEMGISGLWDKAYDPGDEITGHLGIDFRVGKNLKFMVDGIYTYYFEDKQDSVYYESGAKFAFNLGVYYRFDSKYIWGRLVYRHKEKNELNFVEELRNSNGPQLEFDGIMKFGEFTGGDFLFLLESRFYGNNELDVGKQVVYGGGLGINVEFSEVLNLHLRFKYLLGQFITPADRSLGGMETYAGITYKF